MVKAWNELTCLPSPDEPKLHSARLYGEPNAREREEEDHQSAQGVVDGVEEIGEEGFHCLFLESETL